MRQTTVLTALFLLPAVAAHAQPEETCIPGPQGTVSDCVIDSDPSVIEDFAQGGFINEGVSDPGLDESLLSRAGETFAPDDGLNIEVGGTLDESWSELSDPGQYGLSADEESLFYNVGDSAVRVDRNTREILSIDPLSGVDTGPEGAFADDLGVDAGIDPTVDTGIDTDADAGLLD